MGDFIFSRNNFNFIRAALNFAVEQCRFASKRKTIVKHCDLCKEPFELCSIELKTSCSFAVMTRISLKFFFYILLPNCLLLEYISLNSFRQLKTKAQHLLPGDIGSG